VKARKSLLSKAVLIGAPVSHAMPSIATVCYERELKKPKMPQMEARQKSSGPSIFGDFSDPSPRIEPKKGSKDTGAPVGIVYVEQRMDMVL